MHGDTLRGPRAAPASPPLSTRPLGRQQAEYSHDDYSGELGRAGRDGRGTGGVRCGRTRACIYTYICVYMYMCIYIYAGVGGRRGGRDE